MITKCERGKTFYRRAICTLSELSTDPVGLYGLKEAGAILRRGSKGHTLLRRETTLSGLCHQVW